MHNFDHNITQVIPMVHAQHLVIAARLVVLASTDLQEASRLLIAVGKLRLQARPILLRGPYRPDPRS